MHKLYLEHLVSLREVINLNMLHILLQEELNPNVDEYLFRKYFTYIMYVAFLSQYWRMILNMSPTLAVLAGNSKWDAELEESMMELLDYFVNLILRTKTHQQTLLLTYFVINYLGMLLYSCWSAKTSIFYNISILFLLILNYTYYKYFFFANKAKFFKNCSG